MSNFTKEQTYAILADSVYWDVRKGSADPDKQKSSNWTPIPSDWKLIHELSGSGEEGKKNNPNLDGFTARAYKNTQTNEVVIAYAGTEFSDFLGDWVGNNFKLGTAGISGQANQAAIFYHDVKHANPDAKITFTGHSLGGGLALFNRICK